MRTVWREQRHAQLSTPDKRSRAAVFQSYAAAIFQHPVGGFRPAGAVSGSVPRQFEVCVPKPPDEHLRLAIDATEGLLQRLQVINSHHARLGNADGVLHARDLPKDLIETGEEA